MHDRSNGSYGRGHVFVAAILVTGLLSFAMKSEAQSIDMDELSGDQNQNAYFMVHPETYDQYPQKNSRFVHIRNFQEFTAASNLANVYEAGNTGNFVIVKLDRGTEERDGVVSVLQPVAFASDAEYQRNQDNPRVGPRLSSCHKYNDGDAAGYTFCLYDVEIPSYYTDNVIPREVWGENLANVRHILVVNDELVATTTTGYVLQINLEGDLRDPRPVVYLGIIPRRYRSDVVAHGIDRIHIGRGMNPLVLGINTEPMGSKLVSADGDDGSNYGKRTFFRYLSKDYRNPYFREDYRDLFVDLDPIESGILSSYGILSESVTLQLNSRTLREVN